jgi:hypothetical protein
MSESDVESQFGVSIGALPVYSWGKSTTYPLNDLVNATVKDMPPCFRNALEGVPDGLFETAVFLQTVFKACSMPFNGKEFSQKCWMKVEEFWLGYEPSKTKKDAFEKVTEGRDLVLQRKVDPASIPCDIDSSGIKGPKTLDKLFHLELCAPNEICKSVPTQNVYEYIKYSLNVPRKPLF